MISFTLEVNIALLFSPFPLGGTRCSQPLGFNSWVNVDLPYWSMWTCHTGPSLVLGSILTGKTCRSQELFSCSFPEPYTTVPLLKVSPSQPTNEPDKPLQLTSISSFFLLSDD